MASFLRLHPHPLPLLVLGGFALLSSHTAHANPPQHTPFAPQDLSLSPILGVSLQPIEWDLHTTSDQGSTPGSIVGLLGARLTTTLHPHFGLEGELAYIPFLSDQSTLNHAFSYRVSPTLNLLKHRPIVPFIGLGFGAYHAFAGNHANDLDPRVDCSVGARFSLSPTHAIRIDARYVITDGVGPFALAQNIELVAAYDFILVRNDPPINNDWDNDTLPNDRDLCPKEAGPAASQGCPDFDNDTIRDLDDQCPVEAGPTERNGCPKRDRDNDSIEDHADACPDSPGPLSLQGCPDSDNDTLRDLDDRCPKTAGPPTLQGCPDSDNDGFVDIDDLCPKEAGPPETKGCPQGSAVILRGIRFAFASAKLLPEAVPTLDATAKTLQDYPKLRVRIDGHTDDVGTDRDNLLLSQNRAKAVYNYLTRTHNIDPKRLSVQGFGKSQPIVEGTTDADRAQNRRIEFTILETR